MWRVTTGSTSFDDCSLRADEHRLLIVENGRIAGAVFVGPPGIGKLIAPLVQKNPDLTPVLAELREGNWDALGRLLDDTPAGSRPA